MNLYYLEHHCEIGIREARRPSPVHDERDQPRTARGETRGPQMTRIFSCNTRTCTYMYGSGDVTCTCTLYVHVCVCVWLYVCRVFYYSPSIYFVVHGISYFYQILHIFWICSDMHVPGYMYTYMYMYMRSYICRRGMVTRLTRIILMCGFSTTDNICLH